MIITIDGPVATGKSTIAKRVAEMLGYIYLDTGAMYRCLTFGIISKGISPDDTDTIKNIVSSFEFEFRMIKGERHYFFNHKDVTLEIRSPEVTAAVSRISAIQEVREKLVGIQRSFAKGVNAVCEGRDLGTVVFPNADLKIFLTGRDDVRAKRRLEEFKIKFPEEAETLTLDEAINDIKKRDQYDSQREHSPLLKAGDAFEIDTSDLTIIQITDKILELAERRKAR